MDDLNLEEMPELYTLSDDEGNEYTFELLDEVDIGDEYYVALLPVYDDPGDALADEDPLVIMKQVTEGEENFFEEIADEEEFAEVAELFTNRLSDVFDIE